MNAPEKLTLEQQFQLQLFTRQVQQLNREQAQTHLVEAFRQMMLKDNWVRQIFKECYL